MIKKYENLIIQKSEKIGTEEQLLFKKYIYITKFKKLFNQNTQKIGNNFHKIVYIFLVKKMCR